LEILEILETLPALSLMETGNWEEGYEGLEIFLGPDQLR